MTLNMLGLICDFDDTLLATRETRLETLCDTLAHLGYSDVRAALLKNWGAPFQDLVEAAAPGVDYKGFCDSYAEAMKAVCPRPQPGARALLAKAHAHGVTVVVLTSGSRRLVDQDLVTSRLRNHIDRLFAFEDSEFHKPDPKVLLPCLAYLNECGIAEEHMVYVGDSIADATVAQKMGIHFVAVLTGLSSREEFLQVGVRSADVIETLASFPFCNDSLKEPTQRK